MDRVIYLLQDTYAEFDALKKKTCWQIFKNSIRITSAMAFFSFVSASLSMYFSRQFLFHHLSFLPQMTQILTFPMTLHQMQNLGLYLGLISCTMSSAWSHTISVAYKSRSFIFTSSLYHCHSSTMWGKLFNLFYCCFPIYKAFWDLKTNQATITVELQGTMVILHWHVL